MEANQSWLEALPAELLVEIASYLKGSDLITFRQASSQLSAASSGAFGDYFFGCLTTDLTRRSLSRLLGAARFEQHRRRARVLRITPWASSASHKMFFGDRPHDWRRDAATGRIDLAGPTGRAVLACIRDGLPNCRSIAVSDSAWLEPGPPQGPNDGPHLYPTDALALVVALAGDPASRQSPVTSLDVSMQKKGIDEHLLDPEALRRADWSALQALRFDVVNMAGNAGPSNAGAVQPFIDSLLSSAPNLETVKIGGGETVITHCIPLLSQQERKIRHMTIAGRRGRLCSTPPGVLRDWMVSNRHGDRLESLEFAHIYLGSTQGGVNPWQALISKVHAAFPNLRRFKMMECGVTFGFKPLFLCPLLRNLTARLGPARLGCPDDGSLYHLRCCVAVSDEHGGTFRLASAPYADRHVLDHGGLITSSFHDVGVEYELGPSGTAEGMKCALSDIAQGTTHHSPGDSYKCLGRKIPEA